MTRELPVKRVADLEAEPEENRWLVEGLWTRRAVGVIGGGPKLGKTWVGLDLALSVATGTPCLGRFPVREPGPALVYLAEDALPEVRSRIAALAASRGLSLEDLDLFVITAPVLRLDREEHRQSLAMTIRRLAPRILLLDPLIRLHSLDENSSLEISRLLGHLRELNRTFHLAIALVHHATKRRQSHPGQALRGSGDIYAWLDSGLYLVRKGDGILLTVEHRSAVAPAPLSFSLVTTQDGAVHLTAVDLGEQKRTAPDGLGAAVLGQLENAVAPLTRKALRKRTAVRNERLGRTLATLEKNGRIEKIDDGWVLREQTPGQAADLTPELPFS